MIKPTVSDAISSLAPNQEWSMVEDDIESIEWLSKKAKKPSADEIRAEFDRLCREFEMHEYSRLRAAAYPDFVEYLDGLVKGDEKQMADYIAKCQQVKKQFPKPELLRESLEK